MKDVLIGIQANKQTIKEQIKGNNVVAKELSKAYLKAITFNTEKCREELIEAYNLWLLENKLEKVI